MLQSFENYQIVVKIVVLIFFSVSHIDMNDNTNGLPGKRYLIRKKFQFYILHFSSLRTMARKESKASRKWSEWECRFSCLWKTRSNSGKNYWWQGMLCCMYAQHLEAVLSINWFFMMQNNLFCLALKLSIISS